CAACFPNWKGSVRGEGVKRLRYFRGRDMACHALRRPALLLTGALSGAHFLAATIRDPKRALRLAQRYVRVLLDEFLEGAVIAGLGLKQQLQERAIIVGALALDGFTLLPYRVDGLTSGNRIEHDGECGLHDAPPIRKATRARKSFSASCTTANGCAPRSRSLA